MPGGARASRIAPNPGSLSVALGCYRRGGWRRTLSWSRRPEQCDAVRPGANARLSSPNVVARIERNGLQPSRLRGGAPQQRQVGGPPFALRNRPVAGFLDQVADQGDPV